ncbi:MAG: NAD(P)/FAD-dependent oxidoreductase [Cyanobacteria bacterium SID2]|nr:NAD(P)/FAD-dependent oxidoreductase [Cyanobacteria bacterium SID2]
MESIETGVPQMGFEYDWVVLGDSAASIRSASLAARWGARVALILPSHSPRQKIETAQIAISKLQTLTRQAERAKQWGAATRSIVDLDLVWTLASGIADNLATLRSPAMLAMQGIDVVSGDAQFVKHPTLQVLVGNRPFRSRAYLIAPSVRPAVPTVLGLSETSYTTLATLHKYRRELPKRLAVIGSDAYGASLAQASARLGVDVTLTVDETHIFPTEDPELARLLQTYLEADGVRVLTRSPVTQVRKIQDSLWLQAGELALETDAISLASGWDSLSIDLDTANVQTRSGRIPVNTRLQTTNPRVYACGSILGGYNDASIETYEAEIATKNALVVPVFNADYYTLPRSTPTDPPLASVGLSEPQARRRLGDRLVVLKLPFDRVASAQQQEDISGFGKLLVSDRGQILGAQILSSNAPALVELIALAMRRGQSIEVLSHVSASHADVIHQFLALWRETWLHRHPRWKSLQQAWFDWRRE